MKAFVGNVVLTLALAAAVALALFAFNRAAAPQQKILPTEGVLQPDHAAVMAGVTEEGLQSDLQRLVVPGGRFPGSDGCEQTATLIESALREMGYQVTLQPFRMTVPVTRRALLLGADGKEIPGVRIAPLLPNWFRTCTTRPGGIRGAVHLGEKGLAREFEGVDLRGQIVLLPLGIPSSTVIAMGADAVLYFDDGRKPVGSLWEHHRDASLDVPRFFVEGDALSLTGRTVTLDARVDFADVPARNVIGILPVADSPEAVVISAGYDAYSYAPDLAPGAQESCRAAVLLACARQLAAQRQGLKRSVVILASAGHAQGCVGTREFCRALGTRERHAEATREAVAARERLDAERRRAAESLAACEDAAYWSASGRVAEAAYWQPRDAAVRDYFSALFLQTLDSFLMDAVEAVARTRVDWVRDGMIVNDAQGREAASFTASSAARERQAYIQGLVATPPGVMKERFADFLAAERVRDRMGVVTRERLAWLDRRLDEARGREDVAGRLSPYSRLLFLNLDLTAEAGRLALLCGQADVASQCMPADAEVMAQLFAAGQELDKLSDAPFFTKNRKKLPVTVNLLRERDLGSLSYVGWQNSPPGPHFDSLPALWSGHTAFTISTHGDSRRWVGSPQDTLDKILAPEDREKMAEENALPLHNLCIQGRLIASAACQLAFGHGRIVPLSRASDVHTIRGRVVSQIGQNLTPDHPVAGAVVRFGPLALWGSPAPTCPGVGRDMAVLADWNGEFEMHTVWPGLLSAEWQAAMSMDAAVVRPEDGDILWTLSLADSGPNRSYSVRNIPLAQYDRSLAMPVVFRSKGVQVVPMVDPATFQPYASFSFIESKTLAEPPKSKVESYGGTYVCFVPPEARLVFTFMKGSMSNPNLTAIRAFALGAAGAPDGSELPADAPEIAGLGYLAADAPKITNIELDAARSMTQVNSRRLRLQQRYNMADEMTVAYNDRAVDIVRQMDGKVLGGDTVMAKRLAAESVAYSSNVHPVVRKNASDAIAGILFYLLLAMPFAIFMEKLLVGHPDLRTQIAVQGAIFLVFFLVLRFVHPAYQLVRSSYMILLGFITFALSVTVSVFVSTRFSSNIRELQRKIQDRTEVADVSRAGAAMTAFLLGLGHMRKRPVRTGLTVGTLILTTFVMLCFTSVTTDIVDVEFPVSRAPYTGLFVRNRALSDVSAALNPLRELYGKSHIVVERAWAGNFTVVRGQAAQRAEYLLSHAVEDRTFEAKASAMLGLSTQEPRVTSITNAFDVLTRWFETDVELSCYLPRALADELFITEADVLAGKAEVRMGSQDFRVLGLFDPNRIESVLDLDGQSMLPLDVLGLVKPGQQQTTAATTMEAPEDVTRLPGDSVVIVPTESMPSRTLVASVAVAFQGLDYAAAREVITSHLERSAQPGYYGIDGVGFYGGKFRSRSVEGILDLLLPIVIAALTVLNTMRGSVYERRDELYVFNAVGLSPVHIRALFLAEASVYAVVGAVGGYLLAQGVGTGVRALGLTAGLTMNYSSLASVLVSMAIMVVVFLSSLFPAHMAAQLAAPAELMTRERRTSEGDVIEIDLPFTFNRRDRLAIIPYFVDWFENYGEGSSGEYFCSPPTRGVVAESHGGAAPFVRTTTWLKPYDLGVSQSVTLVVRHVPATGDNVATVAMARLSGDRESWERCCHAFIGLLRKRFLTWRAVPDDARDRLYARGQALLQASIAKEAKA